jgi:hypothetical protein
VRSLWDRYRVYATTGIVCALFTYVAFEVRLFRERPAEWSLFEWRTVLPSLLFGLVMGTLKYFYDMERGDVE